MDTSFYLHLLHLPIVFFLLVLSILPQNPYGSMLSFKKSCQCCKKTVLNGRTTKYESTGKMLSMMWAYVFQEFWKAEGCSVFLCTLHIKKIDIIIRPTHKVSQDGAYGCDGLIPCIFILMSKKGYIYRYTNIFKRSTYPLSSNE